jgi:hypothetical protein
VSERFLYLHRQPIRYFGHSRGRKDKIFDSNEKSFGSRKIKGKIPLKFKVGTGRVIKGWDHALMTMSLHERARLTIDAAWWAIALVDLGGALVKLAHLLFCCLFVWQGVWQEGHAGSRHSPFAPFSVSFSPAHHMFISGFAANATLIFEVELDGIN